MTPQSASPCPQYSYLASPTNPSPQQWETWTLPGQCLVWSWPTSDPPLPPSRATWCSAESGACRGPPAQRVYTAHPVITRTETQASTAHYFHSVAFDDSGGCPGLPLQPAARQINKSAEQFASNFSRSSCWQDITEEREAPTLRSALQQTSGTFLSLNRPEWEHATRQRSRLRFFSMNDVIPVDGLTPSP